MQELEFAKIKDIYLPIFNYKFDHGPSLIEESNPRFIGRTKILKRLELILDESRSRSKQGAYLVAGYRGMGKTSLVREAITNVIKRNQDNSNNDKVPHVFELSLAQGDVQEIDLFRQMAWEINRFLRGKVFDKYKKQLKRNSVLRPYIGFVLALSAALFIYNTSAFCNFIVNPFPKESIGYVLLFFVLLVVFFSFLLRVVYWCKMRSKKDEIYKIIKEIKELNQELQFRLYSSFSREDAPLNQTGFGRDNPVFSIINQVLGAFTPDHKLKRNVVSFQQATPKEVEQYLFNILKKLDELRSCERKGRGKGAHAIPSIVFIIDELDKIEPDYYYSGDRETANYFYSDFNQEEFSTKSRRRNEVVLRLFANMKNFLTNAPAKFIFIGGRDMYDASLADIADRESFYSSIFNEVIYVPSFFKDKLSQNTGLTQLAEVFLCHLLYPPQLDRNNGAITFDKYNLQNLIKEYFDDVSNQADSVFAKKRFKILHALQNFILYLTFRSNGSPKKLIELLESYMVRGEYVMRLKQESPVDVFVLENMRMPSMGNNINMSKEHKTPPLYLRLSYLDQYAINLHSNLYRPYVSINSRHLKALGDKLLYSSAFLVDHILKFHKSAFSWRNLEHIPDIVLASRDPNFRKFYSDIMNDLSKQHLRKTINAVFQYKFNSKVSNELRYASRIADRSSAAFNFTLDESYHLKNYYKKKLAVKHKEYKDLSLNKGNFEYIYAIGALHAIIADLHYYEEEYDDAILHYSDAFQILQSGRTEEMEPSVRAHNTLLFVRNVLNLGLCYEKTKMYDRAFSTYRSIIRLKPLMADSGNNDGNGNNGDSGEGFYKRVQLFQRPHIALLHVIEKTRQDGITSDNLRQNFQEYLTFLGFNKAGIGDFFPLKSNSLDYSSLRENNCFEYDKKRVTTLIADYYFNVGSMLFYKNNVFYDFLIPPVSKLYHNDNDAVLKSVVDFLTSENCIGERSEIDAKSIYCQYHPSLSALLYYVYALKTFNAPYTENFILLDGAATSDREGSFSTLIDNVLFVINYLSLENYKVLNSSQFNFLGNILTKIGDSILASLPEAGIGRCSLDDENCYPLKEYILLFREENLILSKKKYVNALSKEKSPLSLKLVFTLYRMAYHCYRHAGEEFAAVFQYKKMLYAFREVIEPALVEEIIGAKRSDWKSGETIEDKIKQFMDELDKVFVVPLRSQIDVSMASVRSQLVKYRISTDFNEIFTPLLYNNLSSSPEVKEYVLLRETIRVKLGDEKRSLFYIGAYSTVSNVFTRVLELKFKGDEELQTLKKGLGISGIEEMAEWMKVGFNKQDEIIKAYEKKSRIYNHAIANAFFCYYEAIRIVRIYGIGYIINHSFMAALCEKMGFVSALYKFLEKESMQEKRKGDGNEINDTYQKRLHEFVTDQVKSIDEKIDALLGKNVRITIDPYEYVDLARIHCQAAREMHTEGKAYRQKIEEMYVLDDDFNDQLTHFCAALERYHLNQGHVAKREKRLGKFLETSQMVQIQRYLFSENITS